jgi:hypothetical protein
VCRWGESGGETEKQRARKIMERGEVVEWRETVWIGELTGTFGHFD